MLFKTDCKYIAFILIKKQLRSFFSEISKLYFFISLVISSFSVLVILVILSPI